MQILPTDASEKVQALRKNDTFQSLLEEILQEIAQGIYLKRVTRGEIVFVGGDICSDLHVIRCGRVNLAKVP